MKIIIVGNGKVGYAIANSLAEEDHDIVIVDAHTAALRRAESTMDVLCVEGNGASISVLLEAGVRTADLVIAVTNQDEINLVCCLIAKKLGAKHTVARVRNTDYRRDEEMLKKEIGLIWSSIPIWPPLRRWPVFWPFRPHSAWSHSPGAALT